MRQNVKIFKIYKTPETEGAILLNYAKKKKNLQPKAMQQVLETSVQQLYAKTNMNQIINHLLPILLSPEECLKSLRSNICRLIWFLSLKLIFLSKGLRTC